MRAALKGDVRLPVNVVGLPQPLVPSSGGLKEGVEPDALQLKKVVDNHAPAEKVAQLEVRHLQEVVTQRVVPAQQPKGVLAALPGVGPEGAAGGRGERVLLKHYEARKGPGVVLANVVRLKELPYALETLAQP